MSTNLPKRQRFSTKSGRGRAKPFCRFVRIPPFQNPTSATGTYSRGSWNLYFLAFIYYTIWRCTIDINSFNFLFNTHASVFDTTGFLSCFYVSTAFVYTDTVYVVHIIFLIRWLACGKRYKTSQDSYSCWCRATLLSTAHISFGFWTVSFHDRKQSPHVLSRISLGPSLGVSLPGSIASFYIASEMLEILKGMLPNYFF